MMSLEQIAAAVIVAFFLCLTWGAFSVWVLR